MGFGYIIMKITSIFNAHEIKVNVKDIVFNYEDLTRDGEIDSLNLDFESD